MLSLRQALSLDSNRKTSAPYKNLYSLSFDGVDAELDIPSASISPNVSGANRGWSISFWLKNDSGTKTQQLFSINKGGSSEFECFMRYNGQVRLVLFGNDSTSISQQLNIDTDTYGGWHHYVFIYDLGSASTSITAYVDNVPYSAALGNATYGSAGTWAAIVNTGELLRIGYASGSWGEIHVDELSVFDNVLSATDVSDIYNSGDTAYVRSIAHLTGWWRMGDPNGTSEFPEIMDASTNSSDATMVAMVDSDITTDVPT